MAIPIIFTSTQKPKNSTLEVPMDGPTFQCLLKDPVDVANPVITIQAFNFEASNYNYCYIEALHRYYYVLETTSTSAGIWVISLEVDVMRTYRGYIMSSHGFIHFAESSYNTLIPDSRLPISDEMYTIYGEEDFPNFSSDGCYVLSVVSEDNVGNIGFAQAFGLTWSEMHELSQHLLTDDIIEQLKNSFGNPLAPIVQCVWLPMEKSTVATGARAQIKLGGVELPMFANTAAQRTQLYVTHEIPLHYRAQLPDGSYTYADYRNVEPYSQFYAYFPGVGLAQIPLNPYLRDGSTVPMTRAEICIDNTTGDISYLIRETPSTGQPGIIMSMQGNIGVEVPVAQMVTDAAGFVRSAIGGIANTVGALAMGNPFLAVGGAASFASAYATPLQQETQVKGSMGGRSATVFGDKIKYMLRYHTTSDNPSNIGSVIGRPLFQRKLLSTLHGLVIASGVYVKCPCSSKEHDMIAQMVNSSSNFIYGGILLE